MAKDIFEQKSRQYKVLLYADNPGHMRALHYIRREWKSSYIGCWHRLRDENGVEIVHGQGKKHCHVLLDFENPRSWRGVIKSLRIDSRFVLHMKYKIKPDKKYECGYRYVSCKDTLKKGFVYLVHHNDQTKEQYTVNDLWGSSRLLGLADEAIAVYDSREVSEAVALDVFLAWLVRQDKPVNLTLAFMVFRSTPYYKAVRSPLATRLIAEHNERFYRSGWRDYSSKRSVDAYADEEAPF